jgi:hypothetical protein
LFLHFVLFVYVYRHGPLVWTGPIVHPAMGQSWPAWEMGEKDLDRLAKADQFSVRLHFEMNYTTCHREMATNTTCMLKLEMEKPSRHDESTRGHLGKELWAV